MFGQINTGFSTEIETEMKFQLVSAAVLMYELELVNAT